MNTNLYTGTLLSEETVPITVIAEELGFKPK